MARVAVNQINQIKKVYANNVKAYYKGEKNRLIKERAELEQVILGNKRQEVEKQIRAKNKNIKIKSIEFDSDYYDNFLSVNFDLSRNADIIEDIINLSGLSENGEYKKWTVTNLITVKFKWDHNNIDSAAYDEVTAVIETNCVLYKQKMKELNQWELKALENAHTGELPKFKVDAAEPTECIV